MSSIGRSAVRPRAALTTLSGAVLGALVLGGVSAGAVVPDAGSRPTADAAEVSVWPPVPGVVFEEAPEVEVRAQRGPGRPRVVPVSPGESTTVPAEPPAAGPVPLRIVQANLKSSLSPAAFDADLREATASVPDFVTLNEAPRRSDDQIAPDGYASYRGTDSNWTRETPVLWRTDRWEQLAVGTRYLSTRQVKWGVRAVNWVTVRHLVTGDVVSVVSAHPAPTIRATRGLLPVFMNGLAALVRELGTQGSVLVGGDLNMGYHGPLWTGAALDSARLASTYDVFGPPPGGTGDHGGATIDYVLFQRDNGLVPVAQGTHELFSDHDAVWAEFLLG